MEENKTTETPMPQEVKATPKGAGAGTGMQENILGALAYLFGPITGIIMLLIEPKNKFVKFHAIQSIIVFGAFIVVSIIFTFLGFFDLGLLALCLGLANCGLVIVELILWVFLMFKAYKHEMYALPVIGDLAKQYSEK